VSKCMHRVHRGVRGGQIPPRGGVRGQRPRNFFFFSDLEKRVMYLGGFLAHGFCRWFSISD
jgi:hypothetical protein